MLCSQRGPSLCTARQQGPAHSSKIRTRILRMRRGAPGTPAPQFTLSRYQIGVRPYDLRLEIKLGARGNASLSFPISVLLAFRRFYPHNLDLHRRRATDFGLVVNASIAALYVQKRRETRLQAVATPILNRLVGQLSTKSSNENRCAASRLQLSRMASSKHLRMAFAAALGSLRAIARTIALCILTCACF